MDLEQLWKSVLGEIELQISRPNFITWLKNSRLVDFQDGGVIVALPNTFTKEWVQNKYHKLILGSLRAKTDMIKSVQFVVQSANLPTQKTLEPKAKEVVAPQLSFEEFKIDPETNLNPRYNLASFVVGKANELATAAASAIIESPGNKYNPFFIYGGTGVGKTHLIQSIGNEIKQKYQNKVRVKYVTSEKFTNDVITAIKNKRMEDIKDRYRNIDVLIIDDIQFIGGKTATEEEFFHTFNALHQNNKQIILSSDRPPRYIPTLEDRLRSRFQGGMIADIGYPDYELRVAVIRTKLQEKNASLPDDIIEFIASKVQKNIRELEGILNRLIFYQQTKKEGLQIKLVEQIINENINQPLKNVSPDAIIKCVADYFQLPVIDLTNKGRKKEIIEPRQIVVYLLRELLDLSYPCIGEKLGKRDHTTAIYAYTKINKELAKNQALNQKIIAIKDELSKL
jgi:chromosomal replication initiator protein